MPFSPLVSVVIPCYNPSCFLEEAIDSVRAQTYWPLEIILVDDGTDRLAACQYLERARPRVDRFIRQTNRGVSAARNAGFREAAGTYVLPLDSDDRLKPNYLAECVALLEAYPEAAYAYSEYQVFGNEHYIQRSADFNLYQLLDHNIISAASLVRKADWKLAGGYDESMRDGYEDWDFWLRLAEHGRYGRYVPKVLYEYRKHGPSLYSAARERHEELVARIRANHPRLYSCEGLIHAKICWEPAVCVLSAESRQARVQQTIEDVQVLCETDPARALAASRAPAFLIPPPEGITDPQSAELCALAVFSGKSVVRLPDGSLGLARGMLSGAASLAAIEQHVGARQVRRPESLCYLTRPAPPAREGSPKRRLALIVPHLGAGEQQALLLKLADRVDRDRCELFIIALEADRSEWHDRWRQITEHVYNLAPLIEPAEMTAAYYWFVVNWKIDVLVIQNCPPGLSIVPFLQQRLPTVRVIELIHESVEAPEGAAFLAETDPHLRVVISKAGRRWLLESDAWMDLEAMAAAAAKASTCGKTLLLGETGIEDLSAAPDCFSPASAPAPLPQIDDVALHFADQLQVTGLRFSEKCGVFVLEIRWRCWKTPERRWRCFAHIVNPQGVLLGSMDHEILRGRPDLTSWGPGDEGYESRCLVLPPSFTQGARLHFGLFDPEVQTRATLWASTVPVLDLCTAAVFEPNRKPPADYKFRLEPQRIERCGVEFANGVHLKGYSFTRSRGFLWLRLRWEMLERSEEEKLYFFGHVVSEPTADSPILLSFDQAFRVPATRASQEILREASKLSARARFLRAGLCDLARNYERIAIRSSTLRFSKTDRCIYLPLPPAASR